MAPTGNGRINKLDYNPSAEVRRPLLGDTGSTTSSIRPSNDTSHEGSFFEQVAEGIQERDKQMLTRELTRYFSFLWAILNW
jgi:hypothetical protein